MTRKIRRLHWSKNYDLRSWRSIGWKFPPWQIVSSFYRGTREIRSTLFRLSRILNCWFNERRFISDTAATGKHYYALLSGVAAHYVSPLVPNVLFFLVVSPTPNVSNPSLSLSFSLLFRFELDGRFNLTLRHWFVRCLVSHNQPIDQPSLFPAFF